MTAFCHEYHICDLSNVVSYPQCTVVGRCFSIKFHRQDNWHYCLTPAPMMHPEIQHSYLLFVIVIEIRINNCFILKIPLTYINICYDGKYSCFLYSYYDLLKVRVFFFYLTTYISSLGTVK